jgi:hypothetical protein
VELGLSNAEPEGSDNEGFSEEWFDEDCGFIYSRQEGEELQLQQLQIEQEASDNNNICRKALFINVLVIISFPLYIKT